jgi:hypothetical protein
MIFARIKKIIQLVHICAMLFAGGDFEPPKATLVKSMDGKHLEKVAA